MHRFLLLGVLVLGSFLASLGVLLAWQVGGSDREPEGRPSPEPLLATAARLPDGSSPSIAPAVGSPTGPRPRAVSPQAGAAPVTQPHRRETDVAGAVLANPVFAAAIEQRLDDPDPQAQREAAELFNEFLVASEQPRNDVRQPASQPPPVVQYSDDDD